MVVISRKNPLDDEDTVIEGVVMERARRCLFLSLCLLVMFYLISIVVD
jgi:hypothetical protein